MSQIIKKLLMKYLILNNKFIRHNLNGLFATFIHYLFLVLFIEHFEFNYIAIANALASSLGITSSFIGNLLFVFPNTSGELKKRIFKFYLLYFLIFLTNVTFMFIWSDLANLNYHLGFLIIVALSSLITFFVNKRFIFV